METIACCIALAAIVALLGFTAASNLQKPARDLRIRIESAGEHYFISPDRVYAIIAEDMDSLEGRVIDQEKLLQIHDIVQNIPWVDETAVYRTLDARIRIDITLHEPMMRVINNKNQSFYVGHNGDLFPLSDDYTARVMLVSGDIHLTLDEDDQIVDAIARDDHPDEELDGLYNLAQFISSDPFWCAFIDHIYLRTDGQIELTPKNGAHIIEFGQASDIEKKFNKLKHFYTGGITQVGWHYYNRINIAYANQVICSK